MHALFVPKKYEVVLKDYTVQFSGLAEGMHTFGFVLERPFFALFEDEVILDGRVEVALEMEKQTRMLILRFGIEGVVEVLCDRCTDPLLIAVGGSRQLIARIGDGGVSTDDDLIYLHEDAFELDLAQHLFDYVHLMLPMRMTHDISADGRACDPGMIRLLEQYRPGHSEEEDIKEKKSDLNEGQESE